MIKNSPRTEGMIDTSADQYQENRVFRDIQNAQALEYDRIEENNKDLALQLSPATATWGLIYYEEALRLPVKNNTDYEARRPAIFAKMHLHENFSAKLVENIITAQGIPCNVSVDPALNMLYITFPSAIPTYLQELIKAVDSVIHAHMIPTYQTEKEQLETSYIFCGSSIPVITQHEKIQLDKHNTAETATGGYYVSSAAPSITQSEKINLNSDSTSEEASGQTIGFFGVMVYDVQTEYITAVPQNSDETVISETYSASVLALDTEYQKII